MREYAAPLKEAGCDTVILGCTHYPLLRPVFQRAFGRDVTLVFSADETAREVAETLARKGFENDGAREGAYRFLTTGEPELFRVLGERFLQLPLADVEHVEVPSWSTPREPQRRQARRTSCGRSSPTRRSSSSRTAACSGRRARRVSSARRSVQDGVPRWLYRSGRGWMTAEYSLLPASTGERSEREAARGKQGGRTVEIQRLIGRALRGVVDFKALGERTVYLDCDVLQADGGTRCAAITGAYVAAMRALDRFGLSKALTGSVAAVSVGVVDGVSLLDLDYSEDSNAEVDVNVVMTGDGRFVEVQATAEQVPFDRERLDELLDLAGEGIEELQRHQEDAVELLASSIPQLSWDEALGRLALAAALGSVIGLERELRDREAGFARTCSSRLARRSSRSSRRSGSTTC